MGKDISILPSVSRDRAPFLELFLLAIILPRAIPYSI